MKSNDPLKAEFIRRLEKLNKSIEYTLSTGKEGNLFSHLFSVYFYLWCDSSKGFKK